MLATAAVGAAHKQQAAAAATATAATVAAALQDFVQPQVVWLDRPLSREITACNGALRICSDPQMAGP